MNHQSRLRGVGMRRISVSQYRIPWAPYPFRVEPQAAREGEEWEQGELPHQRSPIYVPPESEKPEDNVMGKDMLSLLAKGRWLHIFPPWSIGN